ncbi:hypothetical protein [Metabacillus endolithicus]|uniref:TIR domain-containing protein n=1 Tax=Metabacillus endolithicus TaxID=1535204 RepID=A0ABW5BYU1_9BACI|nr:hypothetical protein [Metabacillus endolithicus]UPG61670.1 hypothetical protein MVE64_13230 [Metabacillus endolithicus]
MKITLIENVLYKYLNIFISDLMDILKRLEDKESTLDERLKRIINEDSIKEISENDSRVIVNILNIILKLDQLPTEQIRVSVLERHGNDIFLLTSKELGIYDKSEIEILDQVRVYYQSRLIMMLTFKFKKYFNRSRYDVFLSHSSIDAREIMGLKLLLLYEHDLTSYVDWLDDYQLNYLRATQKIISIFSEYLSEKENSQLYNLEVSFERENFIKEYSNEEITEKILKALKNSDNFFYIDSKNSRYSNWMPFELGYAQAQLNKPIYRILIQYKRTRRGSLKYSSFLSDIQLIEDIDRIVVFLIFGFQYKN